MYVMVMSLCKVGCSMLRICYICFFVLGFFLHHIWHDSRKDESYDISWVAIGGDGRPILDGPWLKICHLRGVNQLKHVMKNHHLLTRLQQWWQAWNLCEFNPKFFVPATHVSSGKIPLWCDSSKVFFDPAYPWCVVLWFDFVWGMTGMTLAQ